MKVLSKLETAAALAAVRAVIDSGPGVPDTHPLKTAVDKLESNLEEMNASERQHGTDGGRSDHIS